MSKKDYYVMFGKNNYGIFERFHSINANLGLITESDLTSVEDIEHYFNIEFSCGDDKYLIDLRDTSDFNKYDGNVSLEYPPRLNGKPLLIDTVYRFTVNRDKLGCITNCTIKKTR